MLYLFVKISRRRCNRYDSFEVSVRLYRDFQCDCCFGGGESEGRGTDCDEQLPATFFVLFLHEYGRKDREASWIASYL